MNLKQTLSLSAAALFSVAAAAQRLPLYLDDGAPMEQRVEDALSRMTLEEKTAMVHAQSKFSSPGVARLGIPEVWCTDGPHGIRPEVLWDEWEQAAWSNDSCTAFPALTCLAATWNTDMARLYGKSIGEEARYRNKSVLLGPGVNICRTPLNGRNFEYMGEDPYLTSRMAVPYVEGVQSNGVAACVKHFALNDQEMNRFTSNVIVDDRALYEIYLPAFKAAVQEGHAWCIMGSYNLYKDQHCCHNQYLLNDILKGEWGFDGVVVSDWGGTHDTGEAIQNGLDIEYGTWTNGLSSGTRNAYDSYYLTQPYLDRIKKGEVDTTQLDDKVRRILRLSLRTTMDRRRPFGSIATPEHFEAARRIAEEGIVLLKNSGGVLPLDVSKVKKVAVIGENAVKMMTVGGGSSSLKTRHETVPLEGLRKRLEGVAEVAYARGYVGDAGGEYDGVVTGQDLAESRTAEALMAEAVALARESDCVLFFGGLNKSPHQDCEDTDRTGLELPYGQDALIGALAAANPNLVVVNISGNPVAMPWVDQVPAIIQGWYLGSEAGDALAAVITGDVNPSGRLPFTFPVRLEDVGAHSAGDYPGRKRQDEDIWDVHYNEGLYVGYRWSDRHDIKPLFPFGHGLSYTRFDYGTATLSKSELAEDDTVTLSVPVTNTGQVAGAEVVQLYIRDVKSALPRPVKELKGFQKVTLAPGETGTVTFTIDKSALSYFDDVAHKWVAEPGKFEAWVAASATDIRQKVTFTLK
ncbi:MAG: glycoside hydrolase family 3 C-terminal domain-containing protein [Prevotellaceae bacterium]|nr:glycoside hydrolase family 3 C-terminal domain-containing protein [Prevotellaceae bacterium]